MLVVGQGIEPAGGRRAASPASPSVSASGSPTSTSTAPCARRRRGQPARRGPPDRRGRAHRLRVGGGRARLDRRRGADERRRARVGHGRDPGEGPRRRPAPPARMDVVNAADLALGYRRSSVAPVAGGGLGRAAARGRRRGRGARPRSPRSCAGGARTSRVARTPARCSPTRRATRPAGSSTPPGARACGSAPPRCRRSTPTSSRPTRAGSADDVWALMPEVRARVLAHSGIDLHPETRTVGFDAP